jgi:Flp pilus assembly protein TadD
MTTMNDDVTDPKTEESVAADASPSSDREKATAREPSKGMTQVGLGLGDAALAASQPSGTLLGIAAAVPPGAPREAEGSARERASIAPQAEDSARERASIAPQAEGSAREPAQKPVGAEPSPKVLPRFDDNPLIAEFAPQRLRSLAAFEGFVPLGSPTRAFSDGVQQPITQTALEVSGASGGIARAPARPRTLSLRRAGVAAGCFCLAGSVVIASQVLMGNRDVETEMSSLTATSPEAIPAAARPDPGASLVGGRLDPPAEPAAAPSEPANGLRAELPDVAPTEPPPVTRAEMASRPPGAQEVAAPDTSPAQGPADAPEAAIGTHEAIGAREAIDTHEAIGAREEAPDPPLAVTSARSLDDRESAEAPDPPLAVTSARSLDDRESAELAELFALETPSDAYRCAAKAAAPTPPTPTSALWREWRQAQQNGDLETALLELCELTRASTTDTRAHAELAALALRWGDARGAEQAARAGLLLDPENAALKLLVGDALALLGDVAESRRLWLEPFGAHAATSAGEATRFYEQRGKAALERSDFAKARTFFRRAVVTSPLNGSGPRQVQGRVRSSTGLSQALAGLGETRAAAAWAQRAALAVPRDAGLQMSYGDALYRAGDAAAARRAWSAAAQIELTPAIRRRLSRGHP